MEPGLAGLGRACKANFPPRRDSQLGHGNLQPCFGAWPRRGQGCPAVRVTAGPTGQGWEDRAGWACHSWGRSRRMGSWGQNLGVGIGSWEDLGGVFLGKGKWGRGSWLYPYTQQASWVPEKKAGTLLAPEDRKNTGPSKGILSAQGTQWPIFLLLGCPGREQHLLSWWLPGPGPVAWP